MHFSIKKEKRKKNENDTCEKEVSISNIIKSTPLLTLIHNSVALNTK